jgi:hypothetical protein
MPKASGFLVGVDGVLTMRVVGEGVYNIKVGEGHGFGYPRACVY